LSELKCADASLYRVEERIHDNGPAWIGYATPSKTGRTLYFNGHALAKLKGQRRADSGGNYVDVETRESYWVSGVKRSGKDRHWAGSGKITIEARAVSDYLAITRQNALDRSRFDISHRIVRTNIAELSRLANASLFDD
jgi:hypothetical protein